MFEGTTACAESHVNVLLDTCITENAPRSFHAAAYLHVCVRMMIEAEKKLCKYRTRANQSKISLSRSYCAHITPAGIHACLGVVRQDSKASTEQMTETWDGTAQCFRHRAEACHPRTLETTFMFSSAGMACRTRAVSKIFFPRVAGVYENAQSSYSFSQG
jgi:hypothetical protein